MKYHKDAKRFETDIAAAISGRRIPLSGAGPEKGDVRSKATYVKTAAGMARRDSGWAISVEAKTTNRETYSLKLQDWQKHVRIAAGHGEHPVFMVRFLAVPTYEVAVVRAEFAEALGLPLDKSFVINANKVWTLSKNNLRLREQVPCAFLGKNDLLVVYPYRDFVKAYTDAQHPSGQSETKNDKGPRT